jgi:hypothetical protein
VGVLWIERHEELDLGPGSFMVNFILKIIKALSFDKPICCIPILLFIIIILFGIQ